LAMDPKTGEILAMVGSADFFNNDIQGQFNVVTGLRQPGSSFKPYVYEQAFKSRKLTMGNLLDDTSRHFAGGQFHDFDLRDLGITDRSGNTLDTPSPPKPKQVLTPQEAYLITYILKDYSSTWGLGWNRPFAGKSGTTNNFRDAWMMAYAPNLVVGAWVGHTGP